MLRKRFIAYLIACAALAPAGFGLARAEETYVEGSASQRIKFDDNIGWTRDDAVSDMSSETALGLNFGSRSEVLEMELRSRFEFIKFFDESDLDSNDQFVTADGVYRTARSRSALTAAYIRDTSRRNQEDDTGRLLLDNIRRQEFTLRPSWSFQATRLDRLSAEAEFRRIDYERRLVDNDRLTGELGWNRSLTETSEVALSAVAQSIDFDTTDDREARVFGLEATWVAEVSPRLRLTIGGRPYWATLSADATGPGTADVDEDKSGFLPIAGLTFEIDRRSVLDASYRRLVVPSGSGNVLLRDRVDASFEQRWSERGSWAVALRYQAQEGLLGNTVADRDFVRVSPSVDWRLTEDWSLGASYRFRWQKFDNQDDDAVSNAVFVTLTFRPESWSLSR